ncbi:hypothetical protein PHBOTO_004404 [Pseudozyma hubeiensis]|nr:hypothetical protein PHBOTO_004404 [Pseudozyma hubeiensis]
MSAPYRYPHYGGPGSSTNRQWVRDQPQHPAAGYDHRYDAYDGAQREHEAYARSYHDAYQRDYYARYPSAYGYYRRDAYGDAHAYSWQDTNGYSQGQAYSDAAAWRGDGYEAYAHPQDAHYAAYQQQHAYGPPAARYAYEAHTMPPHPPPPPTSRAWTGAEAAPKGVDGAPAAPKAMRDAAAATAAGDSPSSQSPAGAYNSAYYAPYQYNGFPHQQQREYHASASSSPGPNSARFQPYHRASPSAPSAPMTRQPPAIRSAPRQTYIEQAKQPSRLLSEEEAADRKLLVILDLNGTLVFRAKSGNGRAKDSIRAVPRPYLLCFLQYCLGTASAKGKELDPTLSRPHGSHFWQSESEPRSAGKAEVVVWSSAQPVNVDSMLTASFDATVRSQILRVWARDTLVPARFYQSKAESIKDLEIVWAELNAWTNDKPSPGRLMAQARDQMDQTRPDDVPPAAPQPGATQKEKKYKGKRHKEKMKAQKQQQQQQVQEVVSASLEAARQADELGPWGAENTVLVDDSPEKARLQPYNQLVVSEFGKEDAGRMKKFIRQLMAETEGNVAAEEEDEEEELEYDSDLSIAKDETTAPHEEATAEEEAKVSKKKPIPESRLDDTLLQTIGVLETLRYQSDVSAFIFGGGIKGFAGEKTSLNEEQRLQAVEKGETPEFWAQRGREVCGKLGIEVRAWIKGEAASATAALL